MLKRHRGNAMAPAAGSVRSNQSLRKRSALLKRMRKILLPGRATALSWFRSHRDWFDLTEPAAGAMAFPRCRFSMPTDQLCTQLTNETGVFIAPGSECYQMEGYLRIGYGHRRVAEGLDTIGVWMDRCHSKLGFGNSIAKGIAM